MATGKLSIDLSAIRANWRSLNALNSAETAAVVKAEGYGLGANRIATALASEGVRHFFVALAEEGVSVRKAIGPGIPISIFSGHMDGDTNLIRDYSLTPIINSIEQLNRHREYLPKHPIDIQLDTGMNRLGIEPEEWQLVRDTVKNSQPNVVISHLACADQPDHPMNRKQLKLFSQLTQDVDSKLSLSATGGILLGKEFHFDLTRPGIGIYGGLPYANAVPVIKLNVPVIQIRDVKPGESVGYGNSWIAPSKRKIATVSAGYADGIFRKLGRKAFFFFDEIKCPVVGKISMDLIGVDISKLKVDPKYLELLNYQQTIDQLADAAGTIGYEILTSLGQRYTRCYSGK